MKTGGGPTSSSWEGLLFELGPQLLIGPQSVSLLILEAASVTLLLGLTEETLDVELHLADDLVDRHILDVDQLVGEILKGRLIPRPIHLEILVGTRMEETLDLGLDLLEAVCLDRVRTMTTSDAVVTT